MALDKEIPNGIGTIIYDYDRPYLFRSQILVTDDQSRMIISCMAVLISLVMPCAYIVLRRAVIACLDSARSQTAAVTQSFQRNQQQEAKQSFIEALINNFDVPEDEDNPLKSIRLIWEHIGSRVQLKEGSFGQRTDSVNNVGNVGNGNNEERNQESGIWPTFSNYLQRAWYTLLQIFTGFPSPLAFILPVTFFLILFVGGVVLAIVGSDWSNDTVVFSASPSAGDWRMDEHSSGFLLGGRAATDQDRQYRIWSYKEACYDTAEANSQCEVFYSRQIPSSPTKNATCPFDGDVCLYGTQGAYKRSTGLLDSKILGINAPASIRFHFRKEIVCSPLRVDKGYVTSEADPEGDPEPDYPSQYLYNYGRQLVRGEELEPFTHSNSMEWISEWEDLFRWSFSSNIYVPGNPASSNFEPRSGFTARDATVSIFFISAFGPFLYMFESDDPIFPAHYRMDLPAAGPDLPSVFWINQFSRAGVLACADSYKICTDKTESTCWDQITVSKALDLFENDLERQRALYLLTIAFQGTAAWQLTNYIGLDALKATKETYKLAGIRLDPEQWKVEVDGIFDAELASMQTRLYDYSRGTYANSARWPNMIEVTPSRLQGKDKSVRTAVQISKLFKFRNSAYTNIPALGFWSIIYVCFFLFLGSRRFSNSANRKNLIERNKSGGYHNFLWVSIFWQGVCVASAKQIGLWTYRGTVLLVAEVILLLRPRNSEHPDSSLENGHNETLADHTVDSEDEISS